MKALSAHSRNASLSASNYSSSAEPQHAAVAAVRAQADESGECISISTEDELPSGQETDDRESVLSSDVSRVDLQNNDPTMLLSLVAATRDPASASHTSNIPMEWTEMFAKARAFADLVAAVPSDSTE